MHDSNLASDSFAKAKMLAVEEATTTSDMTMPRAPGSYTIINISHMNLWLAHWRPVTYEPK